MEHQAPLTEACPICEGFRQQMIQKKSPRRTLAPKLADASFGCPPMKMGPVCFTAPLIFSAPGIVDLFPAMMPCVPPPGTFLHPDRTSRAPIHHRPSLLALGSRGIVAGEDAVLEDDFPMGAISFVRPGRTPNKLSRSTPRQKLCEMRAWFHAFTPSTVMFGQWSVHPIVVLNQWEQHEE